MSKPVITKRQRESQTKIVQNAMANLDCLTKDLAIEGRSVEAAVRELEVNIGILSQVKSFLETRQTESYEA